MKSLHESLFVSFLACCMLSILSGFARGEGPIPPNAASMQQLPSTCSYALSVTNMTGLEAFRVLRRMGCRVCFEEAGSAISNRVDCFVTSSTKTGLVSAVVACFQGVYACHTRVGTDLVYVTPQETSALTWRVAVRSLKTESFFTTIVLHDALSFGNHGIFLQANGLIGYLDFPVDVAFRDGTCVQVLNDLVLCKPGLCWTLLIDGKNRAILSFQMSRGPKTHPLGRRMGSQEN